MFSFSDLAPDKYTCLYLKIYFMFFDNLCTFSPLIFQKKLLLLGLLIVLFLKWPNCAKLGEISILKISTDCYPYFQTKRLLENIFPFHNKYPNYYAYRKKGVIGQCSGKILCFFKTANIYCVHIYQEIF